MAPGIGNEAPAGASVNGAHMAHASMFTITDAVRTAEPRFAFMGFAQRAGLMAAILRRDAGANVALGRPDDRGRITGTATDARGGRDAAQFRAQLAVEVQKHRRARSLGLQVYVRAPQK